MTGSTLCGVGPPSERGVLGGALRRVLSPLDRDRSIDLLADPMESGIGDGDAARAQSVRVTVASGARTNGFKHTCRRQEVAMHSESVPSRLADDSAVFLASMIEQDRTSANGGCKSRGMDTVRNCLF